MGSLQAIVAGFDMQNFLSYVAFTTEAIHCFFSCASSEKQQQRLGSGTTTFGSRCFLFTLLADSAKGQILLKTS